MGAKSADEIVGIEFDWLASDAEGHVALFSTAGGGYAPPDFLRDTDAHDAAIDAILARAAFTEARFAPHLSPELRNTWRMVAQRGVFAYDSDVYGGPYRLVAAPEAPIQVAELPSAAAAIVGRLMFAHLRFADSSEIHKGSLEPQR